MLSSLSSFPGGSEVENPPASAGETRDVGSVPGLGRSPGGGNGNPLQCYCLGSPMDRGAWWASVHGVAKSQTLLSNWAHGDVMVIPWSDSHKTDRLILPFKNFLFTLSLACQSIFSWWLDIIFFFEHGWCYLSLERGSVFLLLGIKETTKNFSLSWYCTDSRLHCSCDQGGLSGWLPALGILQRFLQRLGAGVRVSFQAETQF